MVSTGDLWVLRRHANFLPPSATFGPRESGDPAEVGAEVAATGSKNDSVISNTYANGEDTDGHDVVVWYVLRVHHLPRQDGEETITVPYKFIGFEMEPRDFLDGTPLDLYPTNPPSPRPRAP
jgi:hypothetical protein